MKKIVLFSLFPLLLLLLEPSLACKYRFIHNASELIEFSNEVNKGTNYQGYTVYLAADINFSDLSTQFVPIGKDTRCPFRGTFDGQGYVITDLILSSSLFRWTGLFGFSSGTTIKNVVVGNTCSFTSSHSGLEYAFTSGIIGWCCVQNGDCTIENNVNMANVKYTGSSSLYSYIGGIAGQTNIPGTYSISIVNCVNYGAISNSGSVGSCAHMGGIVGEFYKDYANGKKYVNNCFNYGTITNTGYAYEYYFSGIIGRSYGSVFLSCVSTGVVTSTNGGYIGGIVGRAFKFQSTITHCYWTGCSNYYYGSHSQITDSEVNKLSTITSGNADWLNTYASNKKWNEWAYNQNSAEIKFVVYDGNGFSCSSPLILLPRPARRGYAFLFWCVSQNSTDNCNKKYDRTITSTFTSATILYAQWVVTNCTVVFDVNGGYELREDEKNRTKVFEQKIGELPVTARRGYSFTGWYTAYGEQFTNESLVNNVCNCSLIAHWDPNKYTVILDVNRGNKLTNNTIIVTFDSTYGTIPSPTRDGFSFSGWFTKDNEQITEKTVVNITSAQTLYAHWGPKKYTVTLDVNGGNPLTEKEKTASVLADQAYEKLTIPTRRGYTFAGWYTADGGLITNDTATTAIITRDKTILYAHWTANNYTVAFDVNGGDELTDEVKNKTVTFNTTYDYLPTPTRTGYTFDGWLTADEELITNTTIVNIEYDHTLYAQWVANTYNIEFDPCGGDGLTIITVTFNRSYDCLPTPSREGYTFLWWYIKGTNEIVYNTTVVGTACDHTLCAVWNKNTIVFDVNGGNELDDGKMDVTYGDTYKTLPTPTRTGYTFDGWYTDDNVKIEGGSTVIISGDQTLHAKWIPNDYIMPLNPNGGTLADPSVTVTYQDYYGTLPTPTRTGYTFIGWITENGETITINTIVTDPCHCVLSAGWAPNTYIIIFATNGGNELCENEVRMEVTYDGIYGLLPTPTRKGYSFSGWFDENGNEIKTGMKVDVADNQTFTAGWTPNEYIVEFNTIGCNKITEVEEEEEIMEEELMEIEEIMEMEVTYDAPYDSLPTPTTMKAGYEFDGWFTEDGVLITGESKVEIADDHTLCAEWNPSEYIVTFDVNGGDELADDEKELKVTYGGTYEDLPTPTRKGFKFAGWFTKDGNEEITAETVVEVTEDQTLYAHWDETSSSMIEIVIGKKDMSEEETRKILESFTDAEFTIESIEHNRAGETIANIKFDDALKAEELIKKFMESSDETKKFIRISYSSFKVDVSMSTLIHPFLAFNALLI